MLLVYVCMHARINSVFNMFPVILSEANVKTMSKQTSSNAQHTIIYVFISIYCRLEMSRFGS